MTTIIETVNAASAWGRRRASIVDAASPRYLTLRYRVGEDYSRKRDRLDDNDDEIFLSGYGAAKWTLYRIGPCWSCLVSVIMNGLILINQPPDSVSLSLDPNTQGPL